MNIFEAIRTEIQQRAITREYRQIRLGVCLAMRDYPTGAVSTGLLPTQTAHNAWKQYTLRRYTREQAARKLERRRENALYSRRGYTTV